MSPAKLQSLLQSALAHHRAGRLAEAEAFYRQARTAAPQHFEVIYLSGLAACQSGRVGEAVEFLGHAVRQSPRHAACLMHFGLALLAANRPLEADLAGHTGLNRLPLLARRLAPVQVTYLGYPNTTGLPAMDHRFTDETADPAGEADAFATQRLVRFAPVAWAYQPSGDAPPVAPPPCVAAGTVTFGCFNNPAKITDATLARWGRVLEAVPGSRLRLKGAGFSHPTTRARYEMRLAHGGVAASRVDLLERTPDALSHLALYETIDLAFDTFPYHGTTTTCEALWMGVPVVTLTGREHRSRVGTSLLAAVGHPEWCAGDEDDFVRVATALACDPARLAALRTSLRSEMAASPLLDHPGQAAKFGAALRACWAAWCDRSARKAA